MRVFITAGTMKVCFFSSYGEVSMWMRYTSLGERESTKEERASGTRVKGGRGPFSELAVETPLVEGVTGALPLPVRRADLAMLTCCFCVLCLVALWVCLELVQFLQISFRQL